MSDNKTQPTSASVDEFIAAVPDARKRADAETLRAMMTELTGHEATMWGPSIIGFDSYAYKYPSGREGTSALLGFSPRSSAITIYVADGLAEYEELLARLGKHTTSKVCIYVKRLADIELTVLREILTRSMNHIRATNPYDSRANG